jgi:hypothetical protein
MKLKNTFFLIAMCSGLNFLALPIQAIDDADQPIDSDSKEETVSSSTSDDGGEDGAPGAGAIRRQQNEFLENLFVDFFTRCDGVEEDDLSNIEEANENLSRDLRTFLKSLNACKEGKLHYEGVLLAAKPFFKYLLLDFSGFTRSKGEANSYAWILIIAVKSLLKIHVPYRMVMSFLIENCNDFGVDVQYWHHYYQGGLAYFNAFIHGIWPKTLYHFHNAMIETDCFLPGVEEDTFNKDLLKNTVFLSFLLFLNPKFLKNLGPMTDGTKISMARDDQAIVPMPEEQAFGSFLRDYLIGRIDMNNFTSNLEGIDFKDCFDFFFADDYLLDQWLLKASFYQFDNAPFDEDSLSMAVFQLGRFIKDYKSVAKGTDAKKRKERPEGSDDEEPNPKKQKPNGKDEL